MAGPQGNLLARSAVADLIDRNEGLSESVFRLAGAGESVLVLAVESVRNLRLHRLNKELDFHTLFSEERAVAVSLTVRGGRAWEVISLPYLKALTSEALFTKDQKRLEAALRPRV